MSSMFKILALVFLQAVVFRKVHLLFPFQLQLFIPILTCKDVRELFSTIIKLLPQL